MWKKKTLMRSNPIFKRAMSAGYCDGFLHSCMYINEVNLATNRAFSTSLRK